MKRTAALIGVLMIVAIFLLAFALSPQTKQKNLIGKLPTPSTVQIPPAAHTEIIFSPMEVTLIGSSSGTIEVHIDTNDNKLTAVQLEIGYDPQLLTDVHLQPGKFFPSPLVLLNDEHIAGRISYAIALPPSTTPIEGSGTVAILTMRRNPIAPIPGKAIIKLLPKSLVSAIGIQGSVLKNTNGIEANVTLGQ